MRRDSRLRGRAALDIDIGGNAEEMRHSDSLLTMEAGRVTTWAWSGLLMLLLMAAPVQAAFVGAYAPENFILVNTNADGSQSAADDLATMVIIGGNNGSGLPGSTYFLMFAPEPAVMSFQYHYATMDDPDFPEYDVGGYLAGGKFHPLSTFATFGTVRVAIGAGEGFGFGIETLDNWGGSGSLTISQFEATTVPEPAMVVPTLVVIVAGALCRRRRRPL